MHYYLRHIEQGGLPLVEFEGVERPIMLSSNPISTICTIRFEELVEVDFDFYFSELPQMALEGLATQFRQVQYGLMAIAPDHEHLVFCMQRPVVCYFTVLPEGERDPQALVAWYFETVFGVGLFSQPPLNCREYSSLPFWIRDFPDDLDVETLLGEPEGRLQLCQTLAGCFAFGDLRGL